MQSVLNLNLDTILSRLENRRHTILHKDGCDMHNGFAFNDMMLPDIHDGEMGIHNAAFGLGGRSNYTLDFEKRHRAIKKRQRVHTQR